METLDAGAFSEDGEHATEVNDAETSFDTEGYEPEVETDGEAAADAAPSYFDVDSFANHVVKVKVDGEEVEVPLSEALAGYQRQADYTRKTQAISQQQKQYADAVAIYEALQNDPQSFLQHLAQSMGTDLSAMGNQEEEEYLDPTEREIRDLRAQLDSLQRTERQRLFDAEVQKLTEKYGEDVDVRSVVTHFVNNRFPSLEAAYKDIAYDAELERLRELESKAKRDAEALEKKRKASKVATGGSKAAGAVTTDSTSVRGIRAQFELAKQQLGVS